MNLYFLVEGRRTEMRLYPRWLSQLLPHFTRVDYPDMVTKNSYFLISGDGYPRLLDVALQNAVRDVNAVQNYDYLILCLDADEATVAERAAEVDSHRAELAEPLADATTFRIIVQNRCVETWLLGNRAILPRQPQDAVLRSYIDFYDVRASDPEGMGVAPGFDLHAEFHLAYLKAVFVERNIHYSKNNPGSAGDESHLQQLRLRTQQQPQALRSLQTLFELCDKIVELTR